ncbi:hypothetical protein LLE49_02805 [Alicyclobacillus tolerans]|uniref:hypothetical protein n=1 Tax=Alicyclobacillus tolerans TaxID=90970 RepID=UPI001F32E5AE|nr:hypothetical protein [Alicyclobacillus tolerans]MCF8563669.1 hypothetical protein [Alicyclobacillus tolerans]
MSVPQRILRLIRLCTTVFVLAWGGVVLGRIVAQHLPRGIYDLPSEPYVSVSAGTAGISGNLSRQAILARMEQEVALALRYGN